MSLKNQMALLLELKIRQCMY